MYSLAPEWRAEITESFGGRFKESLKNVKVKRNLASNAGDCSRVREMTSSRLAIKASCPARLKPLLEHYQDLQARGLCLTGARLPKIAPGRPYWVYTLSEESSGIVRYVGLTSRIRARRHQFALRVCYAPTVQCWLRQLDAEGKHAIFTEGESIEAERALEQEDYWIGHFGIKNLCNQRFNSLHRGASGVKSFLSCRCHGGWRATQPIISKESQ